MSFSHSAKVVDLQKRVYELIAQLEHAQAHIEQLEAENEDLHWRCGTESELTEHIESLQNKYAQATTEIENLEKHQQYLLSVLEDYAAVTGMDPAQVLAKRKETPSDE